MGTQTSVRKLRPEARDPNKEQIITKEKIKAARSCAGPGKRQAATLGQDEVARQRHGAPLLIQFDGRLWCLRAAVGNEEEVACSEKAHPLFFIVSMVFSRSRLLALEIREAIPHKLLPK